MKRALFILAIAARLVLAQSAGVGSIWTVVTGTLQSAAVANGNGSTLAVQGLGSVAVTVNCSVACSGGTTITFQVSQDGTNYAPVLATQASAATQATTVVNQGTTPTIWIVPVAGMQLVRAPISAYSAGTITVTAAAVAATPPHSGVQAFEAGTWTVRAVGNAGGAFDAATGAAVPANALYQGLIATTSYPTAASAGNIVGAMGDKAGRPAVVLNTVRNLIGSTGVQSTSGTASTLIAAGATGVFNDIVSLSCTNESSTATIVTISDNGSGGNTYKFNVAAVAGAGFIWNPTSPLPQGTSAAAWDILNSAAVTLDCVAIYAKNQ